MDGRQTSPHGWGRWRYVARTLLVAVVFAGACQAPARMAPDESLAVLGQTGRSPRDYRAAMEQLDAAPDDEPYVVALRRIIWVPGYTVEVREAAVDRLAEHDLDGLKRTIRQQLPRMNAWGALTRLSEIIAERGWVDLTPALVSSLARPAPMADGERPEYQALVALHGADRVPDVVFDLLVESDRPSQQGLRTRCWTLLERFGERERLVTLLASSEVPADDLFLVDLAAAARDLGIVPANREEILWVRRLCEPSRREFWDEAAAAVAGLSAARRETLELRDLAIVVAAARHDPALLGASKSSLYDRLESILSSRRHYSHGSNFNNFNAGRRERLYDWRDELTWGDLAAMLLAVQAMEVGPVVDHLFDFAERDRKDESTEYGGVLALDRKGRFEVLEFVPRIRQNDQRFNASQEMLDAAYTALFQFHFHVQRYRNTEYAGPGFGDMTYAENLRANCLVFTSVDKERMNFDFYRHGGVLVDLGVVARDVSRQARAAGGDAP